jgi:hypothetical protein
LKFLGRAKKFLQDLSTESEPRVQFFNVACASGHRLRGERTEGYQALRCPVCGDGIFVLPRSPLPEPIAPPSARPQRQSSATARFSDDGPLELADASHMAVDLDDGTAHGNEIEIDWENDPGPKKATRPSPAHTATVATSLHPAHDDTSSVHLVDEPTEGARDASSKPAPRVARRVASADVLPTARRETNRERALRAIATLKRNRNRLIFVAVPLLVVAAVGWRIWNNRRQEFPITIERGKTEGIQALDEGNFDRAYQLLSAAKSAVDSLGGEIEDADKVRQAADEAAIFVDQCSQTLEDMLEEAARVNPEKWASNFDMLYKGKSLILDTWILTAPAAGSTKPYQLGYKVFPPGQAGNFRDETGSRPDRFADIDLSGFELFELTHPKAGDLVTIGAKISSFKYDIDRSRWMVGLEPKSGVYIQHTKALDASGWAEHSGSTQPSDALP